MRVLLVVHGFPPYAQGGAEFYAEQHARTLVRLFGDEVHVLTREQDPDRAEYAVRTEQRDGITITWINNTFREVRTYSDSYLSPAIAKIAADVIDGFQPHIAHVHHLTCLSTEIPKLLVSRGVPVLLTLHDYWLLCHRGQLLDTSLRVCAGPEPTGCQACLGIAATPVPTAFVPALRGIDRRLPRAVSSAARGLTTRLSHATSGGEDPAARRRLEHMRGVCDQVTRFLAPSRSIRDRFIRFGLAPDRIELSTYGVDRSLFTPSAPSPARGFASPKPGEGGPLRVGFLGTLMVSKAPHILLEAFRQLPPGTASVDLFGVQADYHGDASYRAVLEPLLSLPGVRLHGPQSRERVPDALASLDALVVPSIWPDTSPFVIREAFLTGLPVVASNIGGMPELVEHELNGLLFEPGDVEGLRRALMRLVNEAGLLDRLRAGAAATPVRSIDGDVTAMRQLYESHVRERQAHRTSSEAPSPGELYVAPRRAVKARPTPTQLNSGGQTPRLAAVVLNFRTAADTAIAVAALMASDRPPEDVIVVDNDAGFECREALARWGDRVAYVRTGSNLGFSAGMNVGIRRAIDRGADFVLLVNSDVVVPPDCLGRLETALAAAPGVGIVGPLVLSRSSPDIVSSSGIDYNAQTGRMRHRGVGTAADSRTGSAGPLRGTRPTIDEEVDAVSGCLMLVRREVFDRVGLLDERYFFGFEEIDFCLRARAAGVRTRLAGRAVAYHEGGQAIGAQSSRRLYFAARNHLMLAQAHANGDGRLKRGARALFVMALNLAHAVKAPGGSPAARIGATLCGIHDHLRGRYGGIPT